MYRENSLQVIRSKVKLNVTNENPYPLAPGKKVLEEMKQTALFSISDLTASILVKGTGFVLWIKRGLGRSRFR